MNRRRNVRLCKNSARFDREKEIRGCHKKYVKELEDLNTHKENVLVFISHDLISPLSGIIGTAEYLKTNLDRLESNKAKEMLDLPQKTAVDELNMIDNLVE